MKWPSWWNVVLGIWLIIAPFVWHYGIAAAVTEDIVLGILVILVALWSAAASFDTTGPAWINLVLGIWVVIAPWVIGYSALHVALTNDVILGIAIIILSAVRVGTARTLARPVQP